MLSEQGKDEKELCMSISRYLTFPAFKKKDQSWQETADCPNNFRDKGMKERRDKSVGKLRQGKAYEFETESAKEIFLWVLFKSLFQFLKGANGLRISLAHHVPSKAQRIPNSVLQHLHLLTVGILYRRKTYDLFHKLWTMSSLIFFFLCGYRKLPKNWK